MLFLVFLLTVLSLCSAQTGPQKVSVRGTLFCGSEIAKNAKVELWDYDTIVRADSMGQAVTNDEGFFEVEGEASDSRDNLIEPEIRIYHDCNNFANQGINNRGVCQREWVFLIPPKYINRAPRARNSVQQWMNIGSINLELIFPKEAQKCDDEVHEEAAGLS